MSTEQHRTGTRSRTASSYTSTRASSRTATRTGTSLGTRAARTGRSLVTRVLSAIRTALATVTPAGWLVLGVVFAGALLAWTLGWLEAAAAGLVGAVLIVVAVAFFAVRRRYDVELEIDEPRVVTGSPATAHLVITNVGKYLALPGRIDVPVDDLTLEVNVPLLRAGSAHQQVIALPTDRRTVLSIGPVTFVREDPVGLLRSRRRWHQIHQVYVHPRITSVPSTQSGLVRDLEGAPTRIVTASDVSFHALREYVPGDSQRYIHWKSTAKTGRLMVRQFEETRRARMTILLSASPDDYADSEEYELVVSALGSVAVQTLRDGRDLDMVTADRHMTDEFAGPAPVEMIPTASPTAVLDALSDVGTTPQAPTLPEMAQAAAQRVAGLSIAVIGCGSTVPLRTLQACALRLPVDAGVVAIVAAPDQEPHVRSISGVTVVSIAVLDDLRHLLARGVMA